METIVITTVVTVALFAIRAILDHFWGKSRDNYYDTSTAKTRREFDEKIETQVNDRIKLLMGEYKERIVALETEVINLKTSVRDSETDKLSLKAEVLTLKQAVFERDQIIVKTAQELGEVRKENETLRAAVRFKDERIETLKRGSLVDPPLP